MANWWGNNGNSDRLYFLGLQNHCRWWLQPWLKTHAPWKKSYGKPRQCIKKQRHDFSDKGPSSQSYCFSISHVWLWELDHKESWAPKNWRFQTVVLGKTLESPLNCKDIRPGNAKGNQFWIFIGRTDAETEAPILWPPDVKNWLINKDPDAGKDWRQEEKGTTEDEMIGWHHLLDGHEFEQTPGLGDGQGSLACCGPRGHRVGHDWMTELTGTVTCSYVYLHTNMVTPGSSQIHSVALHNSSYVHSHANRFLYSNIFTLLQDHLHNKITDSVLRYILKCIHMIENLSIEMITHKFIL